MQELNTINLLKLIHQKDNCKSTINSLEAINKEVADDNAGDEDNEDPAKFVQQVLPIHPVPDTMDCRLLKCSQPHV